MDAQRKPEFFAGKGIRIGIIGCGYVGLPLALRFADVGQQVTGFDTDKSKVEKLNAGQSYIQHINAEKIRAHDFFNSLERHVDKGLAHADTGVIDQNIDLAVIGEELGHHAAHLLGIADVAADHRGARTGSAHFDQDFFQARNGAAAAGHDGAARGKINGELTADAVRSAGDEDDLIGKLHRAFSPP